MNRLISTLQVVSYALLLTPVSAEHLTKEDVSTLVDACEAARAERISPLREAKIAECISKKLKDEAQCRRFFTDYGEPVQGENGIVPRMFHDLPECIESDGAAKHYRLYPP